MAESTSVLAPEQSFCVQITEDLIASPKDFPTSCGFRTRAWTNYKSRFEIVTIGRIGLMGIPDRRAYDVLQQLRHGNIESYYDYYEVDGYAVVSQPFTRGHDLETVTERGRLNRWEMAQIAVDILPALAVAIAAGVSSFDVSPKRILRRSSDLKWVLTGVGFGALTPLPFASPEKLLERPFTVNSLVYEVAASLCYAVLGLPPFGGVSAKDDLVVDWERSNFELAPFPLNELFRGALSGSPGSRFSSVRAFHVALMNAVGRSPSCL